MVDGTDADTRLTVLQVTPALNEGGVERGTIEIAAAVVEAGGRALVASAGGGLAPRLRQVGGELITLPLDRKSPFAIWGNARALERVITGRGVDVVHARSRAPAWSAVAACTRTGTPFVTTYHGSYSEGLPFKRRYNSVMARGRPVIAISEFIAEMIRERHGTPDEDIVVIPRGVDPALFNRAMIGSERIARLVANWRLEDDHRPLFMLPGRLTGWKGHSVLVEAAAALKAAGAPPFLVLLVGGAKGGEAYTRTLEAQIEKLDVGDRIRLVGHCDDMPAAYLVVGCVISASTRPEAFGRVAIEAQAMGRPVIATDHGGARETVAHGETGWRVRPGDPMTMADAMAKFLTLDESARAHMGNSAEARVRALFTLEGMRRATLEVYERAVGRAFPRMI